MYNLNQSTMKHLIALLSGAVAILVAAACTSPKIQYANDTTLEPRQAAAAGQLLRVIVMTDAEVGSG